MNDLERTIIDLNDNVDELYEKKEEAYENLLEVNKRKQNAKERVDRYNKKVDRLSNEYDKMKMNRVAVITVPCISIPLTLLSLLFGATTPLVVGIFMLGCAAGYRFASDTVYFKMLNNKDERLLCRLFPSLKRKRDFYYQSCFRCSEYEKKLKEVTEEAEHVEEEYNEIVDSIEKLKEVTSSVCDLHFGKLKRELLPYYTDLEVVIGRTISNPEKFYANICNGLTRKERNDIIQDMEGRSCANCTNANCTLSDEEKANMTNCNDWYNEVEIGMSKVLRR